MLLSYGRTFNQADFERRLRHYFSDSAPCHVSYELGLDSVKVVNADRPGCDVTVKLDAGASEEENVRIVVQECEKSLYPVLVEVVEEPEPVEPDVVIKRVSSGIPLADAMASSRKRVVRREFRIARIGLNNNTVVVRQGGERKVYKLLYIPVLKYLEFLQNGKYTPESGYDYLVKNGKEKEFSEIGGGPE